MKTKAFTITTMDTSNIDLYYKSVTSNTYKSNFTQYKSLLCRCCGMIRTLRGLDKQYHNFGKLHVFSDIIKNCFGLQLSQLESEVCESVVCPLCVDKLRAACRFRQQVRNTQDKLMQRVAPSGSSLRFAPTTEISEDESYDEEGTEELQDGLDDELDAEQLEEYYALCKGIEPDICEGYSSADEDCPDLDSILTQSRIKTDIQTKNLNSKEKKKNRTQNQVSASEKYYVYNAMSLIEHSYVTPFKNRFNHVLCYYCAQYFLDPAQLREHALTHSYKEFKYGTRNRFIKIDITRIDCRLCSTKIDSLESLKSHLVATHGKLYFPRSKDGVVPYRLRYNEHACALCREHFPQFHGLVRHMDQHYSNCVCEACGVGCMDEKSLQKHMKTYHDGKRYPCDICGSSLKSEYTLLCHKRRIHEKNGAVSDGSDIELAPKKTEKEFACQGCDQTFKSRRYLAVHVRKVHMNYRYNCHVCSQKFFTRFALNNHMPTHTGERNFKCKVCDKTYPRLKTLKEHMRIHNNDRRYRCHICGQAFIQNCSLKGHMKSKHPEHK